MYQDEEDDENIGQEQAPPSRSRRKREAEALQKLGEELVGLAPARLAEIELPERLADAIHAAQAMHQHGARKRQLQYIGKLMREVDPEPIRGALAAIHQVGHQATALHHRAERWRDRLLHEGDAALEALVAELPQTDRQQIRQWVRSAHRELKQNRPPAAARALYRYLHDLLG